MPAYCDRYYGTPVRISRTPREYPFAHLGDLETAIYTATYVVHIDAFSPYPRGEEDPEAAGFYCVGESRPTIEQGSLATFRRTYASLPPTQTVEDDSIMVTRPAPGLSSYPGAIGDYRIFQPDSTLARFDAYLARSVTSDTGTPSFYPTGGTYLLGFAGQLTGPLAYNASAAAVQTALNALSTVQARGTVAVTGSYNSATGFAVAFSNHATGSVNTSGLPGTPTNTVAPTNGGYTQTVTITAAASPGDPTPSIDTSGITTSGGAVSSSASGGSSTGTGTATISLSAAPPGNPSESLDHSGVTLPYSPEYGTKAASISSSVSGLTTTISWSIYVENFAGNVLVGSYTVSLWGSSTSISVDATEAEVQSAVAGLAAGHGACSVSLSKTVNAYDDPYSISVTATVSNAITGGNYTLTLYGGTTSALPLSSSAGTIESAVNALSAVSSRGTASVSGGWDGTALSLSIVIVGQSTITSGTFTATFFSGTSAALAYNASVATVQAALNALSGVAARGGCVVTVPPGQSSILTDDEEQIIFTVQFSNPALTSNLSLLVPTGGSATIALTDGTIGRTQSVVLVGGNATRDVYAEAHGISAGDTIYLEADDTLHGGITAFEVLDANNVRLTVPSSAAYAGAAAITEIGPRVKADYRPGSDPVKCDRITRYSLTAITPDRFQGDDTTVLLAALAGSGLLNYRVADSERWPTADSPIRALTTTRINAADLS
jgi:hypothetical protein